MPLIRPEAALTPTGKRQARALSSFLKSRGVRFNVVYSSPFDRARGTALAVFQLILLSASSNKMSKLKERAKEYAALIMEELDPENLVH
ncbi:hypothetical protein AgCh_022152 [Apium graveolens]